MSDRARQVLFLCTGNSARSIFAEAALGRIGGASFQAHSAGSHPKGALHPITAEILRERGHDPARFRSKSWDEFTVPGAPRLDFIFTVCDAAAGEICPVWPGQPITAHWGVPDPAAFVGSEDERLRVFRRVYLELARRIELFTSLPFESLDRLALRARLDEIGKCETPVDGRGGSRR